MPGHKDWLEKASGDLEVAKMASRKSKVYDVGAYLTHQATEKAFKTYLVFCHQPIPKTHDLKLLIGLCIQIDSSFKKFLDDILMINPYASYSRYPDDRFSITKDELIEAIGKATKILNFIKKKIDEPRNPTSKLFVF